MLQQNFDVKDDFNPIIQDKETGEILFIIDPRDNVIIIPHTKESIIEQAKQFGGKRFFYEKNEKDASENYPYILLLEDKKIPTGAIEIDDEVITILRGREQIMDFAKQNFKSATDFYKALAQLFTEAGFSKPKMQEYFSQGIPQNRVFENDDLIDKVCRIEGERTTPYLMVNQNNDLLGLIRVLAFEQCAYASDEIVSMQAIVKKMEADQNEERCFEVRKNRMSTLFNLVREQLQAEGIVSAVLLSPYGNDEAKAFYVSLGAKAIENQKILVRGQPELTLKQLQTHVIEKAKTKLEDLNKEFAMQKGQNPVEATQPSMQTATLDWSREKKDALLEKGLG